MHEDDNSPKQFTLNDAKAFIRQVRNQTHEPDLNFPSLNELRIAKESGEIVFFGKEWTREGWIYDPILDKVNKHPRSGEEAAFRYFKPTISKKK